MEFTEKVVILRVGTFRENDCWVRFLSPSRGIVTGFAFGGRKSRRRFCGCLDHLNQVLFRVSAGRRNQYLSLEEGTLLQGFVNLKKDFQKVGMVGNCLRFFEAVHTGEARSADAYALVMSMLGGFDALSGPPSLFFPVLFRIALAFEQGYTLDVGRCASCGVILQEQDWAGCVVEEGYFLCPACSRERAIFRISWQGISLLDHLKKTGIGKWVDWTPDRQLQAEICGFADRFIRYHLGIADEDNRFVRC
jgi:DNA repair protein RecO (recombination protein O)